MTFIDANNVVGTPLVTELGEPGDGPGDLLLSGVRADREVVSVAAVSAEFHLEYILASDSMLVAAAEQLGGFACEHAAHDQLNSAALPGHLKSERLLAGCLWGGLGRVLRGGLVVGRGDLCYANSGRLELLLI